VSRILIVEDDDDIRDLLVMALTERGHEVHGAENGRVALALVDDLHPDLVVLDLRMPVMDGKTFASTYRARPGPHARILVMTAARDAALAASGVGADAVLSKPFELREVMELVDRL
jgi:two-component system OmpR family response regulator